MKTFSRATGLLLSSLIALSQAESADTQDWERASAIPLYEKFSFTEDYRVNQTAQGAIRWASLAPLAGAALGSLLPQKEDTDYPLLGFAAGFVIGIPVGGALGYARGSAWEREQARDGRFHARRLRFGYEVEGGGSLASGSGMGWALAYRMPEAGAFRPDEIQVAWNSDSHQDKLTGPLAEQADEERYSLRLLRSFRDGVFNPFVGLGFGYADGHVMARIPTLDNSKADGYAGPFVEALAGVKVNLFDLTHLKAQFNYEPYGPWYQLRDKGEFDYLSNVKFRLGLGTFIF